jgi:uncharacterized protein YyaL (SSP411 family)
MNRLQHATSPYLLQHASNPVDWYEWGQEALERARAEQRPIFLSIGYAACHWCHVMEHESFEDPQTAALMNENYVNIKVDREQRPDLDSIYMSATVAMTGSGGWPMSVFLTPDLKPFYTGTYFPSISRYNLPSFRDVLTSLAHSWAKDRDHVLEVADRVSAHVRLEGGAPRPGGALTQQGLDSATQRLSDQYDWGFGGWGGAPKFPQPMTIEFLLRRSVLSSTAPATDSPMQEADALKPAFHALRAMARGGMYDVVGGGFSRYSTDVEWRVPHFEKMLYDNAQLALVYLHAWQVSSDPFFRRICEETLGFVIRELTSPEGGFYSSLDADSEGEEGRFYLWDFDEISQVLGEDLEFFRTAYFVAPQGNWEGRIILQRAVDDGTLAARFELSPQELAAKLAACRGRLLAARAGRVRPATDDKVLTAWNALMLSAFAQAARYFPTPSYLRSATRAADFLLTALRPDRRLRRAWRAGRASDQVFLEDHGALVCGLLDLYEADFDQRWFGAAVELADEMVARFDDPSGVFFDTPSEGEELLLRPRDLQDNATPCGNSLACDALLRLAAFTGRNDFRDRAEEMLSMIAEPMLAHPTAFGRWLQAADFSLAEVRQLAVIGDPGATETQALIAESRRAYRPHLVAAASSLPLPPHAPNLLHDRPALDGKPTAYLCEGFVCKLPVTDPHELRRLLDGGVAT